MCPSPVESRQSNQLRFSLSGVASNSSRAGVTPNLAVIAVLYDLAETCNADLDAFWDTLPLNGPQVGAPSAAAVPLTAMLAPLLPQGYYAWTGSLTTPPCSEGVDWSLLKGRLAVCARQVERLKLALSNAQGGVDINNRATQPMNHRVVSMTPEGGGAAASLLVRGATPAASRSAGGLVLALEAVAAVGLLAWSATLLWRQNKRRPSLPQLPPQRPSAYTEFGGDAPSESSSTSSAANAYAAHEPAHEL